MTEKDENLLIFAKMTVAYLKRHDEYNGSASGLDESISFQETYQKICDAAEALGLAFK